jgi:pyruvate-formate lyase
MQIDIQKKIENMAKKEKMLQEKKELMEMVKICKRVPANLPKTFWEALQYHLFMLA